MNDAMRSRSCGGRGGRRVRRGVTVEALESRKLLSGNVTVLHGDQSSTGQNLTETVLTPSNVNSTDFGRQFFTVLDGQVYAQPLAVESINITRVGSNSTESIGVHNVLYVATMHDSLFAVDADTGAILWQDSFLQINGPEVTTSLSPAPTAGVIPFPAIGAEKAAINTNDVGPEEGVFGTPVINSTTNVLYCISYTQELRIDTGSSSTPTTSTGTGVDWHFVERLWAINLADGSVAATPVQPAGAPVPASQGETIADTVLNPSGGTYPPFSSFTGYEYYAGPYIKASGDNGDSADSHNADTDGWVVNPDDLTTNSSHSVFAGTTPYATGDIALNALIQPTRTGLTLLNGVIYFGMTSHGDDGPYYGWVLGYNANTLQNVSAFVTTPTWENYDIISGSAGSSSSTYDSEGAIWGGEQSITTDGTYLYMSLGNGAFDWTSTNFPVGGTNTTTDNSHTVQLPLDGDYGNATIKLAVDPSANQGGLSITSLPTSFNPDGTNPGVNGQNVNGYGLRVTDFFVASNMIYLNYKDQDVGSGGVTLIPSNITSTVPGHVGDPMLVTGGKEGRIYLIDRNNMGGFNTGYFSNNATDSSATYANGTAVFSSPGNGVPNVGPDAISYDRVLGEYEGLGALFTIPSFYMNGSVPTLVIDGNSAGVRTFNLNTFQYTTSSLPANDNANPTPLGTTSSTFANHGSTSTISANGTSNAIVWNIDAQESTTSDDLRAFNISMGTLYDSGSTGVLTNNTTNDTANKFSVPTVFNGMVYVGIGAKWGTSGVAQGAITGFGLQSSYLTTGGLFGAPTGLTGTFNATYNGTFNTSGVSLSWARNSTDETETEIDRSSDNGSSWSVMGYVPNGASGFTDTTAILGQSYEYRVRAISGANTTAFATSATILGSLNVSSGTYTIAAPASGAGFQAFSLDTLSLGSGAKVLLATASAHSDRTVLVVNSLNVAAANNIPTGSLDVGGNDLIVHNSAGNVASALSTFNLEIRSGYNGGAWSGKGIISSTAAANTTHLVTVGVSQNGSATSFDQQPVTTTDILVKYTYYGDADVSGGVDASDYSRIDSGFLTHATGWFNGDFNYDGVINGSDYTLIDNAFNTQGETLAAAIDSGGVATNIPTSAKPASGIATRFNSVVPITIPLLGTSTDDFLNQDHKWRAVDLLLSPHGDESDIGPVTAL